MAQVTQYISDFSGKPVNEEDLSSIRVQDGSGAWYRLDGTSDEIEKLLGKALDNGTNITSEVMIENDQKLSRAIKAKVDSGELLEASSVRGQTRKQSVNTSSGKTPEELAAIRAWAKSEGYEVSDRGRIKADVVKAYEESKGARESAA